MITCEGLFDAELVTHDDGYRLNILRADPQVHISSHILTLAIAGELRDDVSVEPGPGWPATWAGAIIKISGANQTVVYQVGQPCGHDAWHARWPD